MKPEDNIHWRLRRNIFENKKYVEEYRASDIAAELGLDRMKLIRMAQLLGSDYSPGVAGIGTPLPVPQALVLGSSYLSLSPPHTAVLASVSSTAAMQAPCVTPASGLHL